MIAPNRSQTLPTQRRLHRRWWALVVLTLLSLPAALLFGSAELSLPSLLSCLTSGCIDPIEQVIFWEIRVPRVAAGFIVGAALAVAGATLQTVTRNSLADPYLFGIVAGASFGVSLSTLVFNTAAATSDSMTWVSWTLPGAAFLGALLAVLLVQLLSHTLLGQRIEQMLLAGVAISFILSAGSHFVLLLANPFAANQMVFWLMGSLARIDYTGLWLLLALLLGSLLWLWLHGPYLDALLMGEARAQTLGVNVARLNRLCLLICSALTACVVAYCGGIGFVGLMIPHIVRYGLGGLSRPVLLGCALLGGVFLLWVDVLARAALSTQEIPIGIITAALGGLFFLLAMQRGRTGQ